MKLKIMQEDLQQTLKSLNRKKENLQEKLAERNFYLKKLKDEYGCKSTEEGEIYIKAETKELKSEEEEIETEFESIMEEIKEQELL